MMWFLCLFPRGVEIWNDGANNAPFKTTLTTPRPSVFPRKKESPPRGYDSDDDGNPKQSQIPNVAQSGQSPRAGCLFCRHALFSPPPLSIFHSGAQRWLKGNIHGIYTDTVEYIK